MDDSAFKSVLDGYEATRISLDRWLSFWTWLVIFGVAFELVFIIWDHFDEFGEWFKSQSRGIISAPSKPSRIKLIVELFSVALVVIGIVGELRVDAMLGKLETNIRDTNERRVLQLQQEAGEAETSAHNAAMDAGTAQKKADGADIASGKAQDKADAVAGKAEELDRQLAATKTDLDAAKSQLADAEVAEKREEQALVDMAVCNAPRVIPIWSIGNTKTSIDPLKPFSDTQVIIEFIPDNEARRAALNIAGSLDSAGWKLIRVSAVDGIRDGVEIQPYVAPRLEPNAPSFNVQWQAESKADDTADALVDFLHSYNWQAKRGWLMDTSGKLIRDENIIPRGAIRVQVGLYPPVTFVSPPGAKALSDATAQFDKEREETLKKLDAEQSKREEEMLKRMTPEQAAALKSSREETAAREKKYEERYSGPCKALTGSFPLF